MDFTKPAIKHNPPGIRAVARKLNAHLANLAHYTGCQDTDALKQRPNIWLMGPGIVAAFLDAHNNSFESMTLLRPRQDRIFQFAYNLDAPAMLDLPIPLPTDPSKPTLTKAQRMDHAIWTNVVAKHQIITRSPTHFFAEPVNRNRLFPGLPDEQHGPGILRNGHSPEDWSCAYWLLRASVCHSSRTKVSTNTPKRF